MNTDIIKDLRDMWEKCRKQFTYSERTIFEMIVEVNENVMTASEYEI